MEKVPNLNIFSQRQLKKSSSASRISYDNSNRPSSSLHPQGNNNKPQNFYGQALKLLNTDSKITTQLKNIQTKHDQDGWKKTNIRKIAKRQPFQQPLMQSNTHFNTNVQNIPHHQPVPSMQVQMNQTPKIYFNQGPNPNRMTQSLKSVPVFIPPGNSFQQGQLQQVQQTQQVPFHIVPQNQQTQHQNNVRMIQAPPFINPNLPPSIPMQRRNSAQQIRFGEYSQTDKMMPQCNITPICNNQQDKNTQNTQDRRQFSFCNKNKADSPHKTYNPFLFDATYLLQIKQSESRLPDITSLISNRQYSQEIDKKQQLLQQLYEIREDNIVQSKQFLRQLDCLINQFQSKQATGKPLEESVMRNSRRSLFSKIE